MLGSSLRRSLTFAGMEPWDCSEKSFSWTKPDSIVGQFARAARAYALAAGDDPWTVIWAAGTSTVGSDSISLERETAVFRSLLDVAAAEPGLAGRLGRIIVASSAGTVYGESSDMLTEKSPTAPVSAYGKAKLEQESLLRAWSSAHPHHVVLVARISNLYGEAQNLGKPQGIISHLCKCVLTHRPVHISVPLDTIRDYLYVGDCADRIVACMPRMGTGWTVKIIAAERITTLSDIIATVARVAKRQPRILLAQPDPSVQHVRNIRFRSVIWQDIDLGEQTPLLVGIHRVYAALAERLQDGVLSAFV